MPTSYSLQGGQANSLWAAHSRPRPKALAGGGGGGGSFRRASLKPRPSRHHSLRTCNQQLESLRRFFHLPRHNQKALTLNAHGSPAAGLFAPSLPRAILEVLPPQMPRPRSSGIKGTADARLFTEKHFTRSQRAPASKFPFQILSHGHHILQDETTTTAAIPQASNGRPYFVFRADVTVATIEIPLPPQAAKQCRP